jgi:hypothetical protein
LWAANLVCSRANLVCWAANKGDCAANKGLCAAKLVCRPSNEALSAGDAKNFAAPARRRDDERMIERRALRSETVPEALRLLLESHRRKLRARALAVATPDGRMLAGVGESPKRVAQAAVAIDGDRVGLAGAGGPVATWRLRAGGRDVIVASLGGNLSYDVGAAVKRILG